MRGARAGSFPASSNRGDRRQRREVRPGSAGREGHGRPFSGPASSVGLRRPGSQRFDPLRGAAVMRRAYAALIALAVAIIAFHEFSSSFVSASVGDGVAAGLAPIGFMWALPSLAAGAVVGAALVVASASRGGMTALRRLGLPGLGPDARARANGMTWGAIALLGVHFTREAFEVFPGGNVVAAVALGSSLGYGTFRLHRHAIDHEAYRTFNLVAMLLAAGSLASMSLTPTGEWWTHNFSTLGTSDDFAAACFNIAIVVSGAGMAAMSAGLTRAVSDPRYGVRRGGLSAMRVLIVLIGMSLMGVGLVPIDGATDLHNLAACGAAASFAVLCLGVQVWARRLPRSMVIASYASIAIEVVAMVAYDGMGVFNLTVFEIVAFTLVFAWLIALVAITHAAPDPVSEQQQRHVRRIRATASVHARAAAADRPRTHVTQDHTSPRTRGRTPRAPARAAASHDVHRALRRHAKRADEPPDTRIGRAQEFRMARPALS